MGFPKGKGGAGVQDSEKVKKPDQKACPRQEAG